MPDEIESAFKASKLNSLSAEAKKHVDEQQNLSVALEKEIKSFIEGKHPKVSFPDLTKKQMIIHLETKTDTINAVANTLNKLMNQRDVAENEISKANEFFQQMNITPIRSPIDKMLLKAHAEQVAKLLEEYNSILNKIHKPGK